MFLSFGVVPMCWSTPNGSIYNIMAKIKGVGLYVRNRGFTGSTSPQYFEGKVFGLVKENAYFSVACIKLKLKSQVRYWTIISWTLLSEENAAGSTLPPKLVQLQFKLMFAPLASNNESIM